MWYDLKKLCQGYKIKWLLSSIKTTRLAKGDVRVQHPKSPVLHNLEASNINSQVQEKNKAFSHKIIRLMFQDEAVFGWTNRPYSC